jgi:hypothetical protein
MPAPVSVPVSVMGVVMVMPMIMIPVVIMPIVGSPGSPVSGIISPIPGGPPDHISGMIDKSDQWPGCNIIIRCGNNIYIIPVNFPGITRIGGFGIYWFNNIIRPVKSLVSDQLDLHCAVP